MSKKILMKISKKMLAITLSISMLFSSFMPLATVFALTSEEKADLVEFDLRGATSVTIDNNVATINYDGGNVTVSGNDLLTEEIQWNYGDHTGPMQILYTTSTSLTFYFHAEEERGIAYRVDGSNAERPEGDMLEVNDLLTFSQKGGGYDIEVEFVDESNPGQGPLPMPNGATYDVIFGNSNPSWNVLGQTVTASIQGKDLTDGFIEVVDSDTIQLTNFDMATMEVEVRTQDGFRVTLYVDEDFTTCLAWTQGGVLPAEEDLYFDIVERREPDNGLYQVEFGQAEWDVDGEHVTASIEGENMVLNNGPVELEAHTAIHLEGYNHETMQVTIEVEMEHGDNFGTVLFVDDSNNTSLDAVDQNVHVPNDGVVYFRVERIGGGGQQNPPQEGNTTAIVRVNGVEGSYMEWVYDPEGGHEEPRDYDGRDAICNELKFNINGGAIWGFEPEGETVDPLGWFLYNELEYQYDEEDGDTTVTIGLFTEWHRMISSVSINDASYPVGINYNSKSDWIAHVDPNRSEFVGYYVTVPKAEDNIYRITVQIDPNDIQYVSEFRWSNDPELMYVRGNEGEILYDEFDQPLINPEYIEHAKLEIIGAQITVGDQTYNYDEDDFSRSFDDDFISFGINNHLQYVGGYLIVPSDTVVTVRITPDPGYQLVEVYSNGDFIAGGEDEPFEYTFTVPVHREEFRVLFDTFEDTEVLYDDYFDNMGIEFASATTIAGNYELYVDELVLPSADQAAYEEYAEGYDIVHYFNIELNQAIYNISVEGGLQDYDGWYLPLTNLNKKATFTLTLHDAINADSIVLIRSNGDGTFETIVPEINGKVMTFESKRFGDFAIATMNLTEVDAIDVTVTPPTPGVTVNVTMVPNPNGEGDIPVGNPAPEVIIDSNAPYTVERTGWVNGTCNGGANLCNEFFNGTFDVNGEYHALITLRAKTGNKFTYNTLDNITVNDRELDTGNGDAIVNISDDGETVTFIVLISPEQEEPVMKGDMNGNGRIDLADVITLLRKYLNNNATPEETLTGDMDNNGTITLSDIIALLRLYLNS